MFIASRWRQVVGLTLTVGVIAACHGGASDAVDGGGLRDVDTNITLVAYSVPEPGWTKVIAAFNASEEGRSVQVITSYGASGDQSRGVVAGKPADIVNFSVQPDITRLVKAGNRRAGLGYRSVQRHPVRVGGDAGGAQGQPKTHPGLG